MVGIPRFRATQSAEFGVAVVVKMLREITGRHIHPTSITMVHARNTHSLELERFFGCPIEFGEF